MSSGYERDVTHWIHSLNNDEERVRTNVILSVARSGIPTMTLIPVLEKGLNDSSPGVRFLSTSTAIEKGRSLSTADAHAIEVEGGGEGLNFTERLLLIGYYSRTWDGMRKVTKKSFPHVRWIIENAPESEAARFQETTWFESDTCREYKIAKHLWMNHLAREPENISYLKNAVFFFAWYDRKLSFDSLTKGQSLESWNPYWSEILTSMKGDDDTDQSIPLNFN